VEFSDHIGVPMREGLLFAHNTLVGAGLRDRVRIGVAGKLISAFDLAAVLAIGADWANSARGFMFALGCIQSMSCHTNRCPTGIATQNHARSRALVVPDKAERVWRFHARTVHALAELLAAAGLNHPDELCPHHLVHRVSTTEIRQFDRMHYFGEPNDLIEGRAASRFYQDNWDRAHPDHFAPA
jgi:glutamate synthase domain-containing protein 2